MSAKRTKLTKKTNYFSSSVISEHWNASLHSCVGDIPNQSVLARTGNIQNAYLYTATLRVNKLKRAALKDWDQ